MRKILFKIGLAAAVLGALFGIGVGLANAASAAPVKVPVTVTHTYWQEDDGIGAVVTTTAPNNATITVDGNTFAASSPGPNSFAAYLQAGSGQWIYGPDKAYVPVGYPNPAVPHTAGLTKVWSGKVDGYVTTLYTGPSKYSAASTLEAWFKA
jgi:hypothetical protein